ncbi:hypothetical protein FDUTEX481_03468 [Tolypothrix sp. PCC 7601]|nr:hypothetical protein FDUTEX481_03468 [Tolypothrix sp. PCC 7601]
MVGDWDDVQETFGFSSITNQPPKSITPTVEHKPAQETVTNDKSVKDHERLKKAQQKREARSLRNSKFSGS